jgi:Tfp pilus assembly protein PilF
MSSQTLKLVAIGFQKKNPSAAVLHCEELYIYGVLSQLARFADIQYKNLQEQIDLTMETAVSDLRPRLRQICQSQRAHFLFTGAIVQSETIKSDLNIHFQLYDATQHEFSVHESTRLGLDIENMGDGDAPQIPVEALNQVINETVAALLKVIFPGSLPLDPAKLAPMSTSLPAMKLVLKAHRTHNAAEKIALYEGSIREDIQMETSYYHLARIYRNEYELEKSVLFYREALKISQACPRNKATYATEAGISCALLGRSDLAQQWWERAIQYDATYINPYFNIANTYEDQDNYPAAEQYFLKAQELAPDDFRTFLNLARIYSKMGIWDKAIHQYQYQLASEDQDPWCHSDLATCYLNLGDLPNAKHHLEKTVQLDPEGEAGQYAQLILSGLG